MSKMELLAALEAEKLRKEKWKQYCGTPCICLFERFIKLTGISRFLLASLRISFAEPHTTHQTPHTTTLHCWGTQNHYQYICITCMSQLLLIYACTIYIGWVCDTGV